MIIDVSNTIGKHRFKPEIKMESLLLEMDQAGVDIAIIHCYAECPDNESIETAMKKYPNRFVGLFTVNPWVPHCNEKLEEAFSKKGFQGLFLDPLRCGFALSESEIVYPLMEICKQYNKTVLCMGAAEVFSAPVFFSKIALDFPDVNIIMGRMGLQYDNASAVHISKSFSNVFLETSGSMDFNVKRAINNAGEHKVLLGTGTPDTGCFQLELSKVRHAANEMNVNEDLILAQNAARLFNISVEEESILWKS